jgi:hypothetical protein
MYPHSEYTLLWFVQLLPLLSLTPLPPIRHFSTAFNTYPYILCLYRCYILWYCWCFIILFSFPSLPKFHRIVPLSQICSTYEFVYDHVCFVYIFIFWIYLPHMRKKCGLCLSEPGLLHLTWRPPIASIYL